MTSKELVRSAVRHLGPERVPVTNLIVDWQRWINERRPEEVQEVARLVKSIPDDSFYLDYDFAMGADLTLQNGIAWDEWGIGWIMENKVIMKHRHPFQSGYGKLDYSKFPDPNAPGRFDKPRAEIRDRGGKYVLARAFFTIFERMWFLRGMENMLVDPLLEYDEFRKLRNKLVEFNLGIIENWVDMGVDGIFFSDDWGSQHGLFIKPDDWRRFYKPCYKILFDRVKAAGIDVWMHLDGNINSIIPDLIEVGLDVYNPVQNQVCDIGWLKKEFGGHLCFNGGVDVQQTLPFGTPKEIRDEVDRMVEVLGSSNGGFVMGASHTVMPDTPMENMRALIEAMGNHTGFLKEDAV